MKIEALQSGNSSLPMLLNLGSSIFGKLTSDSTASGMYKSLSSLPKMPNYFKSYGKNSIDQLNEVGLNMEIEKARGLSTIDKKLSQGRLQSASEIDAMGGSLNTRRALRAMSERNYNNSLTDAIGSLESSVMNQLNQLGMAKSNILADRDRLSGENQEKSFLADMENKRAAISSYYGMKQQGNEYMIQGMNNLGQSLNQKAYNDQFLSIMGSRLGQSPDINAIIPWLQGSGSNSSANFTTQIPNPQYNYVVPNPRSNSDYTPSGVGIEKLYNVIGHLESGGNYNIFSGGEVNNNLSNMTISQVLQLQDERVRMGKNSYAGFAQIGRREIREMIRKGVVSPNDIFNKETQFKLHSRIIKDVGYDDFISGKMTPEKFAYRLAGKYAALPKDSSGDSYYKGKGNNRALTSYENYINLLNELRNYG